MISSSGTRERATNEQKRPRRIVLCLTFTFSAASIRCSIICHYAQLLIARSADFFWGKQFRRWWKICCQAIAFWRIVQDFSSENSFSLSRIAMGLTLGTHNSHHTSSNISSQSRVIKSFGKKFPLFNLNAQKFFLFDKLKFCCRLERRIVDAN